MLRFSYIFALLGIFALSACTLQPALDPRGNEVALVASWRIDGEPANQALCDAAGIDTVQLVFLDGTLELRYPEFFYECEDGGYTGTGDLSRGVYQAFWESQDVIGNAVHQSNVFTLDADTLDNVAYAEEPNFTTTVVVEDSDAVLSLAWDSDITATLEPADCATIEGVNFIAYALHNNATNELIKDYGAMAGCQDQIVIPEEDLEFGVSYRVDFDGGPEDGAWYWQGSCFFEAAEGGVTTSCEAADVRYRMSIDLLWDKDLSPSFSAAADCEDATVQFMSYSLRIEGGSEVIRADNIACGDAILFEEPVVTEGINYELTVFGHEDSNYGAEWSLVCVGLTAGSGVMHNGACEIERG